MAKQTEPEIMIDMIAGRIDGDREQLHAAFPRPTNGVRLLPEQQYEYWLGLPAGAREQHLRRMTKGEREQQLGVFERVQKRAGGE